MTVINSAPLSAGAYAASEREVQDIDNAMDNLQEKNDMNLGFKLMYQEWMQKILLSDGVDGDENQEW